MDSKEEVKLLAEKIERRLKRAGVRVERFDSPTGSIYMWLDAGLAFSIRISDHEGKFQHRYRYNMLTCPYVHKRRHNGDAVRFYYNPSEFFKMISAILSMRKSRMKSFGYDEYRHLLSLRKNQKQTKGE